MVSAASEFISRLDDASSPSDSPIRMCDPSRVMMCPVLLV